MGFWDRVGGAAKWVTDPKQILTAAGFALGGPVGAGVGRAVGGVVPQSAGPVPWGALGADTDEFRKSTLADGLQWGDVGQAGKDFMSGYSAGKVGQQIPGIKDLEGAFGQGGMWGGPGMPGGANQPQLGADPMMAQGAGVGAPGPTPFEMSSNVGEPGQIPGQSLINAQRPMPGMPAPSPAGLMQDRTLDLQEARNLGGPASYSPPPQATGAFQSFQPGPTQFELSSNVGGPGQVPEVPFRDVSSQLGITGGGGINVPSVTPQVPEKAMWKRGLDAAGKWFGELTPMEKIYLATQGVGAATGGRGHTIGREGTALLGEMGMFSPTPRYRAPRFDQWRSA